MKNLIVIALIAACAPAFAGSHARQGYITKNGTYVAPSYATNPNGTKADNYSSKGNVNPYTGKAGTVDPYADLDAPRSSPSVWPKK